jgi:tRNA A37 methylthiotransferase MiaB
LEGKSVQNFFEIFWNITSNERTHQLDELLRRLGLEYVDDLVGTTVKLIIKKNTGSRGAMLTIVSREPWSEEVTVTSEGES